MAARGWSDSDRAYGGRLWWRFISGLGSVLSVFTTLVSFVDRVGREERINERFVSWAMRSCAMVKRVGFV